MTATGQRGRYAVIPTHNRIAEVTELVISLVDQVDAAIVIDNASDPAIRPIDLYRAVGRARRADRWIIVMHDEEQPPNLSRLWNAGLGMAAILERDVFWSGAQWDVAILNDDAVLPDPEWFERTANVMRFTGAAAACSHPGVSQPLVKREPDHDLIFRMFGPAFILRGELADKPGAPLRVDERLRWWWNDTDLDWKARALGGMVVAPGPAVHNRYPNSSTVGELAEQAGRDRHTFAEIHGFNPW